MRFASCDALSFGAEPSGTRESSHCSNEDDPDERHYTKAPTGSVECSTTTIVRLRDFSFWTLRDALVSTLAKLYDQIGLDPTKPPIPTLAEYMAATTKAWSDR